MSKINKGGEIMKDRLKQIRNALNLTQAAFADKLNISRSIIATYEGGHAPISERTIADICEKFYVNEQWLRTGEGPIFNQQSDIDNQLAAEVAKLIRSEDEFTKKLIHAYLRLPDDAKDKVKDFVENLMK